MKTVSIEDDLHKIMKDIKKKTWIPIERQVDDILRPKLMEDDRRDFILRWLSKNHIDIIYMIAVHGMTMDYLESVYETYKDKPEQLKYWKNQGIKEVENK